MIKILLTSDHDKSIDVDDNGFVYDRKEHTGTLSATAARDVLLLLNDMTGTVEFDIIAGRVLLTSCTLKNSGPDGGEFLYVKEEPAPR